MLTETSRSAALPAAVRVLVGASLRMLVHADEVAERASETTHRLRAAVPALPRQRRPYDEL